MIENLVRQDGVQVHINLYIATCTDVSSRPNNSWPGCVAWHYVLQHIYNTSNNSTLTILGSELTIPIFINVNVNVHVYSPDIPVGSADCTIYTPGIGTHSFTVSSSLGRIQHLRTLLQL